MIYEIIQTHPNYGDYTLREFDDLADAQHFIAQCYENDRAGIWDFVLYELEGDGG